MQLRGFLQRSENNFERNEYFKDTTKISPPAQYSMSFPGKQTGVLYILVSIQLHIGNDKDKGHYVCGLLYYNTGIWRNCDNDPIIQYPGYPMNVYDDLSNDKNKKDGKQCVQINHIRLCPWYI